ncbi:MAG: hypothetical protein ACE5EK_00440 [Nitrospinales bacterium]
MNASYKIRTRLFKFILFFATLIVCVSIMEISVRWLNPMSNERWSDLFFSYDPILGNSGIANKKGIFASHSFNTTVEHNKEGFRDVDHDRHNSDGKFRIISVGDSFTWGHGVDGHEIYMKVLEQIDPRIETINLGGPGGDPAGELLAYILHGLKYEHDLVMVGIYLGNDLTTYQPNENTSPPRWGYDPDGYFDLIGQVQSPEVTQAIRQQIETKHSPNKYKTLNKRIHYWLIKNFQFYTFLDNLQDGFADRIKSSPWFVKTAGFFGKKAQRGKGFLNHCLKNDPPGEKEAWNYMEEILTRFKMVAEGASARLYLVFIPHVVQTSDSVFVNTVNRLGDDVENFDIWKPNRKLAVLSEKLGIDYLDLLPALREETQKKGLLYYRRDPHWTPAGHRAAAYAIQKDLQSRGFSHPGSERNLLNLE